MTVSDEVTYSSYLSLDDLLNAQHPATDEHDELLFVIIHQVYELWFKLILHETETAMEHLGADRVVEATRLLRRVSHPAAASSCIEPPHLSVPGKRPRG